MIVSGIIAEYNPFHNGHLYHLQKAKELSKADLMIGVISGNFSQRGEVCIIDKFQKTQAALSNGLDLIVELPYIYTVQNGSVFGKQAVEILKMLGINYLVFGSETNNLEELQKFADFNINIDHLKEIMSGGNSFPAAYGLLAGSLYPNDLLAISYLRALKDSNIQPIAIQRTNAYHSEELNEIASAKAIRKAIKEGKDYTSSTPIKVEEPLFTENLYPYLRRLLMTRSKEELRSIFLVNEGIENLLVENAFKDINYADFIKHSVSKRYTRSRVNRTCLHIMTNVKKEEVSNLPSLDYVRILGFNAKGQEYLRSIKKKEDLKLISQFKNLPEPYKTMEWKASNLYASLKQDPNAYLKQELKGPIIIKK